jgi:Uma2 family endonuclease
MVDMQVVALPARVPLMLSDYGGEKFSDAAYLAFCRANPNLRVERTAEGEILIVPPAGSESSHRNARVTAQLDRWADDDDRGVVFDSSAQFMLADGSALSPDAAWVSNTALRSLSRQKRKEFLPLCPEFVVEVMSPSDRLKQAKAKMDQWVANGAQLAWLIDGDAQTIYVYRKGGPAKAHRGIAKLAGEGPVEGFVLKLTAIWKGLA